MKRTRAEVEKNEESALCRVTELARENTDLRRDRERLRRWLRFMRQRWLPLERLDSMIGGVAAEEAWKIRAALRGEEPPRRKG